MNEPRRGQDDAGGPFAFGRLPPGPHRLPRELVRENQRQRILLAALEVFADRGFAAATVEDLIRAAHVSRATFYEIFADKEACFADLYDEVVTRLWNQVAGAVSEVQEWPARVRLGVEKTVRLLAEDPRLALICAIEAPAGAPQVRARHDQRVEDLCAILRLGRLESPQGEDLPEILETALASGTIYVVGRSIVFERGAGAEDLIAELPDLLLLPYLD